MFVKKPRSSEAYEGDTVIIMCEVIGDPKPEVVWLRDFLKVSQRNSHCLLAATLNLLLESKIHSKTVVKITYAKSVRKEREK